MVKGNKFKTAEFLEKQGKASTQKSECTAALWQAPASGSNKKQRALAADPLSAQHAVHIKCQQHPRKPGSKKQNQKAALTEVVNASTLSVAQHMPRASQNLKRKRQTATATDPSSTAPGPTPTPFKVKKQKISKPAVPTILAAPAPTGKAVNSNWAALKGVVASKCPNKKQALKGDPASARPIALKTPQQIGSRAGLTPVVALDCEMVGVGPEGTRSALARVCVVNNDGGVLLDQYVKPAEKVTDYRTFVSGIEPAHLKEGATTLSEAQQQVAKVLTGRILVGHAVHHDLQALLLSHPRKMTRDTATYPPLMMSIGKGQRAKPRSLRHLAETELGLSIQAGEHSPIDDARSALYLYHKHRKDWERHLLQGTFKDLVAPRLQKKIVMQQVKEAAAAGLDTDLIKDMSTGRRQQSFAKLAEHDDMVDL